MTSGGDNFNYLLEIFIFHQKLKVSFSSPNSVTSLLSLIGVLHANYWGGLVGWMSPWAKILGGSSPSGPMKSVPMVRVLLYVQCNLYTVRWKCRDVITCRLYTYTWTYSASRPALLCYSNIVVAQKQMYMPIHVESLMWPWRWHYHNIAVISLYLC